MIPLALALAGFAATAPAPARAPSAPDPCEEERPGREGPSADLYCIDLFPARSAAGASGTVAMRPAPGPFGVSVTPEGTHAFDLVFSLAGLPDPGTLGDYRTYVAWAAGPLLDPVVKLGEVGEGVRAAGRVALDKFLILVSAEPSPDVEERTGPLVLRGQSPGTRVVPADLLEYLLGAMDPAPPPRAGHRGHAEPAEPGEGAVAWIHPPMPPDITMLPALERLGPPSVTPFLPTAGAAGAAAIPEARPREVIRLADGDSLRLVAGLVRRTIGGRPLIMYAFNGQHPGPLLWVPRAATVTVVLANEIEWPTSIHWHGVRVENRFDGVPGVTQAPVAPGETFTYRLRFPDAGIYWYHPHHREDVQQDLGLYGNLFVRPDRPDYFGPANREEFLILDDLLLGEEGLVPYGEETATHVLMGRFGNVFLVNGRPGWEMEARRGDVVRFFLTNASSTRTFNLSIPGARMKAVGSDLGNFAREEWVESVPIAPAERYVLDVRFPAAGAYPLLNRVRAIDHLGGRFLSRTDTLGLVRVAEEPAATDHGEAFRTLREHPWVIEEIEALRAHFDGPPDRRLVLELEARGLPLVVERLMRLDSVYFHPVEWDGTMPMMNWIATTREVRWIVRDRDTGKRNEEIDWRFRTGELVKLRITNRRESLHAMDHPIHIHGQRFLVLARDGVPNDNPAWKDTAIVPPGSVVDVLLELSNPGAWMLHCHVAEHLEAGMRMIFTVSGEETL